MAVFISARDVPPSPTEVACLRYLLIHSMRFLSLALCVWFHSLVPFANSRGHKPPHGIKTGLQGPSRPPAGQPFNVLNFTKKCTPGEINRNTGPGVENVCSWNGIWVQCAVGRDVHRFTKFEILRIQRWASFQSLRECTAEPDMKFKNEQNLYVTLKAIDRKHAYKQCYRLQTDFYRLRDTCGYRPGRTLCGEHPNMMIYFDTKYITDPPKDNKFGDFDYPYGTSY
jgi:hypothetical protein